MQRRPNRFLPCGCLTTKEGSHFQNCLHSAEAEAVTFVATRGTLRGVDFTDHTLPAGQGLLPLPGSGPGDPEGSRPQTELHSAVDLGALPTWLHAGKRKPRLRESPLAAARPLQPCSARQAPAAKKIWGSRKPACGPASPRALARVQDLG